MTHLSPEHLADVDAIAGHEHLAVCERCRDQWLQQRAVRDLLRGLPDPGAVPPDVATGLAEALSRLSPADVEPPTGRPTQGRPGPAGATVVPLGTRAARRDLASRARPWLAAAAAVVVLGGGATALVSHPWSSRGGASSDTTSAGSAAQPQEAAPTLAREAAARVHSTGTDYERKGLASQVRELLTGTPTSSDASGGSAFDESAAGGDTRLASADGLASCVSALGLDVGQVTAVDLARFEGAPAALLVLRDAAGEQDVWVVGRGCRRGDDQTRYFVRLP